MVRGIDLRRIARTRGFIGRNWPPTNLTAEFENFMERDVQNTGSGQINDVAEGILFQFRMTPDMSAWFKWNNGDAAGTRTTLATATKPRNWDRIISMYTRGRHLSSSILVKLHIVPGVAALSELDWYVCCWISSPLDANNPLNVDEGNLGNAAPWTANNEFRALLLKSRRVMTKIIRANRGGGSRNTGTLTMKFHLAPFTDRMGDVVIGGRHVRIATNHGGGTIAPTDVTVADLLTDAPGHVNRINIMCFPVDPVVAAPVLDSIQVWGRFRVELYDRVIDVT